MARAQNDPKAALDAISLAESDENRREANIMARGVRDATYKNFKRAVKRLRKSNTRDNQVDANLWYQAWEESKRFLAQDSFVDFLDYVELDRPVDKRFWVPRRGYLMPVAKALQDIADGRLDELILNMPPRVGKLISDDTPVLTTGGWKAHGDLTVGDFVFGPDGKPHMVTHVHPKDFADRAVTFSNGERIECHHLHEWPVYDHPQRSWDVVETHIIEGHVRYRNGDTSPRLRYALPQVVPLDMPDADLPVAPYTLGAWLGAGKSRLPNIDVRGAEVPVRIRRDGYRVKTLDIGKYGFDVAFLSGVEGGFRRLGLCDGSGKAVPGRYLTASIPQRLDVLAGLIDSCGELDRSHRRYTLRVDSELSGEIVALIATFGWKSTVGDGRRMERPCKTVSFSPTVEIPCAIPERRLAEFATQRRVLITSVEEIEPKRGNCITVEGGVYLVGRSLVPTHNSTIMTFFMAWMCGRENEASHLYTSYSSIVTGHFYDSFYEIVTDSTTYRWGRVFPDSPLVDKDAKNTTIDLGRQKGYPTLTCRSIDGSLNGTCDASGLMIGDDFCSGFEEAISAIRMKKLNDKVNSDWLSRGTGNNPPIIWMGTRWSVLDPIGQREDMLLNEPAFASIRWKKVSLPALDENDESNFNADYGVGFSTERYHQVRAQYERQGETATWLAVYMQQPIDRSGAVFNPDTLLTFTGDVPDGRTFMAVDPAFGGGDFTAAPVCRFTGGKVYVLDVVFSNGEKDETMPMIIAMARRWNVGEVHFEASKMLSSYVDEFRKLCAEICPGVLVTSAPAPSNQGSKADRILFAAPNIRSDFLFRTSDERTGQYRQFMDQVAAFTPKANKHAHDDAPDSLAQASSMVFTGSTNEVRFFRR